MISETDKGILIQFGERLNCWELGDGLFGLRSYFEYIEHQKERNCALPDVVF